MNVVAVKHGNSKKHYIYRVPDNVTINKGIPVIVRNRDGSEKVAVTVCNSRNVDNDIITMFMGEHREVCSSVIGAVHYFDKKIKHVCI